MTENNVPEGCLPFDIEKALSGWPVVMRGGQEAKVFMVSDCNEKYPVKGCFKISNNWECTDWTKDGAYEENEGLDSYDLFLKKKTKTYYANVYKNDGHEMKSGMIYDSEQEAIADGKQYARDTDNKYIKTLSFELEDESEKPKTKTLWIPISKLPMEHNNSVYETMGATTIKDKIEHFPKYAYHTVKVEVPCE